MRNAHANLKNAKMKMPMIRSCLASRLSGRGRAGKGQVRKHRLQLLARPERRGEATDSDSAGRGEKRVALAEAAQEDGIEHALLALGHVQHPVHALLLDGAEQAAAGFRPPGDDQAVDEDRQSEVDQGCKVQRRGNRVEAHEGTWLVQGARNVRMRSSAPCRMSVAATLSITSARRLREVSASSSARSAATVDSRSSQKKIGSGVSLARLRTKARVAWTRGPADPSRFRAAARPRSLRPVLCRQLQQALRIRGEPAAAQCHEPGGDLARHIRKCEAQGLAADVDADEACAMRQGVGEISSGRV